MLLSAVHSCSLGELPALLVEHRIANQAGSSEQPADSAVGYPARVHCKTCVAYAIQYTHNYEIK